jgi:hypothetical protein
VRSEWPATARVHGTSTRRSSKETEGVTLVGVVTRWPTHPHAPAKEWPDVPTYDGLRALRAVGKAITPSRALERGGVTGRRLAGRFWLVVTLQSGGSGGRTPAPPRLGPTPLRRLWTHDRLPNPNDEPFLGAKDYSVVMLTLRPARASAGRDGSLETHAVALPVGSLVALSLCNFGGREHLVAQCIQVLDAGGAKAGCTSRASRKRMDLRYRPTDLKPAQVS